MAETTLKATSARGNIDFDAFGKFSDAGFGPPYDLVVCRISTSGLDMYYSGIVDFDCVNELDERLTQFALKQPKWKTVKHHQGKPDNHRTLTALSLRAKQNCVVVVLLGDSVDAQFSTKDPPFSQGVDGQGRYFGASTVMRDGTVTYDGAAPSDGCRCAFFLAYLQGQSDDYYWPFNIHLESVRQLVLADDRGQTVNERITVRTPIIIDPDIRYPEGAGGGGGGVGGGGGGGFAFSEELDEWPG